MLRRECQRIATYAVRKRRQWKQPGWERGWIKGRVKVWSVLEAERRD